MCGTFYVDDETAREIEKAIRKAEERAGSKSASYKCTDDKSSKDNYANTGLMTGDIRPSDYATVLTSANNHMVSSVKRWGFPGFQSHKLIINARAESALERKMFRESVLRRRLIIPATGFYEWNPAKEKVTFSPYKSSESNTTPILFFAGFYNHFDGEDKFVILTTKANESVKDTHERMPLILNTYELHDWLFDDYKIEDFLRRTPPLLKKTQAYMQQSLFR